MKKRKGFTLIELVMVIVIIGILAAIAIPRFINLRQDARKAACDGNVSAIRSALSAFYAKGALSPAWATSRNANATSGFPKSLANVSFGDSFFSAQTLPMCPASGNIYNSYFSQTLGTVTEHPLGLH